MTSQAVSRTATPRTVPRAHYHHLATSLRGLEEELRWGLDGSARIPKGWEEIALGAGRWVLARQFLVEIGVFTKTGRLRKAYKTPCIHRDRV